MHNILAIDIGTTAIKTAVYNSEIELIAQSSLSYDLVSPSPDIVELEPSVYLETLKACIKETLKKSEFIHINSICMVSQGETLIPVNKFGQPLHNAVVWMDNRAVCQSDEIRSLISDNDFYDITGIPSPAPSMPLTKIMWFKNKFTDIYNNTHKFLLLSDYLNFILTDKMCSDYSILSSTGYWDIKNKKYSEKILSLAHIDIEKLPPAYECAHEIGRLTEKAQNELGILGNPVIYSGAMDQIASILGSGCLNEGAVTETTGTCMTLAVITDEPKCGSDNPMPVYNNWDDKYVYLLYTPTAGIVLKWFKDNFCYEETEEALKNNQSVYNIIDRKISECEAAFDNIYMLPHFAGKWSPVIEPEAKGAFLGLTLSTTKYMLARAILEAVGFMIKENIEFMKKNGLTVDEIYSLGGGSESETWSKIKADITGLPVTTFKNNETTVRGAAVLAAVGCGILKTSAVNYEINKTFVPDNKRTEKYNIKYENFIKHTLNKVDKELK